MLLQIYLLSKVSSTILQRTIVGFFFWVNSNVIEHIVPSYEYFIAVLVGTLHDPFCSGWVGVLVGIDHEFSELWNECVDVNRF